MPRSEPVVIEVGRYTAPRLRAGAIAGLVGGAALLTLAVTAGGTVLLVLGLLVGALLVAVGLLLTVAANASRGARMVVDERGVTWDAGAATWHVAWPELSSVGVRVLRSTSRRRGAALPGSDRVVRLLLAIDGEDPDADRPPLRRLRASDEPAPWTHRMPFAARGDDATRLEVGLTHFAGERFAGLTVEELRPRRGGGAEGGVGRES